MVITRFDHSIHPNSKMSEQFTKQVLNYVKIEAFLKRQSSSGRHRTVDSPSNADRWEY